jgi:hypothetical protein
MQSWLLSRTWLLCCRQCCPAVCTNPGAVQLEAQVAVPLHSQQAEAVAWVDLAVFWLHPGPPAANGLPLKLPISIGVLVQASTCSQGGGGGHEVAAERARARLGHGRHSCALRT